METEKKGVDNLNKANRIVSFASLVIWLIISLFFLAWTASPTKLPVKLDYTINLNANENVAKALQYAYLVNNQNVSKTCLDGCLYAFHGIAGNDTEFDKIIAFNNFSKERCRTYCIGGFE